MKDLSAEGIYFPKTVKKEQTIENWGTCETRTFIDGSRAEFTKSATGRIYEISRKFPDGKITWYNLLPNGKFMKIWEDLPNGTKYEWYKSGKKQSKKLRNGAFQSWYENGKPKKKKLVDGTFYSWYENGNPKEKKLSSGAFYSWHENGKMAIKSLPNGEYYSWYPDGQIALEILSNNICRSYYPNGKIAMEYLPDENKKLDSCNADELINVWISNQDRNYRPDKRLENRFLFDNTSYYYYPDGHLAAEFLSDKIYRSYYPNGKMAREECGDGTKRLLFENGQLFNEELPDGKKTHFCPQAQELSVAYPNGKIILYGKDYTIMRNYGVFFVLKKTLPDGTKITYFPRTKKIAYESCPDGTKRGYYENGKLKYEVTSKYKLYVLRDGTKKYKLADGKEIVLKTDKSGRVVYHSVNGVEDTKEYLARRILAAKKVYLNSLFKYKGKVTNNDGTTRARTVAKKMSPAIKAVGMYFARMKAAKQL